jgi:hypothetical protein
MREGSGITDRGNPARTSSQSPVLLHTRKRPDQQRSYNGVSNMLHNHDATFNSDHQIENIAAELTGAVYLVALGHGLSGSWLELELGLWRAMAETVKRVGYEPLIHTSIFKQ